MQIPAVDQILISSRLELDRGGRDLRGACHCSLFATCHVHRLTRGTSTGAALLRAAAGESARGHGKKRSIAYSTIPPRCTD